MVIEKIDSVYINEDKIRTPTCIDVDSQTYNCYDWYLKKSCEKTAYKKTRFLDENGKLCAEISWSSLLPCVDTTVRIVGLARDELTDEVYSIDFSYKSKGVVEIYDV